MRKDSKRLKLSCAVYIVAGLMFLFSVRLAEAQDGKQWITYAGAGPQSKHIVLISGDEEYRSEEALPMLAQILSVHHGFKCTVLFPINPETGNIDPEHQTNIPAPATK